MALKINVGLAKKVGLPDYGSLGATCHVEFEADQTLLQDDLDQFHARVSNAFVACHQAVTDELARRQGNPQNTPSNGNRRTARASKPSNGARQSPQEAAPAASRRFPDRGAGNGSTASQKQIDYIRQLSSQIKGLTPGQLHEIVDRLYGKRLEMLSGVEASGLIDTLKAIKAGKLDPAEILTGART